MSYGRKGRGRQRAEGRPGEENPRIRRLRLNKEGIGEKLKGIDAKMNS